MLETTINRSAGGNAWRLLGKIKLGIKEKRGEKEFPKDLDYFVIPEAYRAKLGERPTELSIVLANAELGQNFDSRAAAYQSNGSRACHTSDDRIAHRYTKPQGENAYRWVTMECPNVKCEYRQKKKCKERGYFSFMVPAAEQIGVFLIVMGTTVGISQIYTTLKTLESLCHRRPNGMQGIRLKLRRERKEFYQDLQGTGQQAKIVKYIPTIEIDYAQLLIEDQRLLGPMLGRPIPLPAIAAPEDIEDHDEDLEGGVA